MLFTKSIITYKINIFTKLYSYLNYKLFRVFKVLIKYNFTFKIVIRFINRTFRILYSDIQIKWINIMVCGFGV